MIRILIRLVRSPVILLHFLIDIVIVPMWLRLLGVKLGHNCRFNGLPTIIIANDASVTLGDSVIINSRQNSNILGLSDSRICATGIGSRISIGNNTGLSGVSIYAHKSVSIGDYVLMGAGSCIWDTDFHPLDPEKRRIHQTKGAESTPVIIENDVFIGARAIILKGVKIGHGAVIGAGSIVIKDVLPGNIVAGIPAKVVGNIENKKVIL